MLFGVAVVKVLPDPAGKMIIASKRGTSGATRAKELVTCKRRPPPSSKSGVDFAHLRKWWGHQHQLAERERLSGVGWL